MTQEVILRWQNCLCCNGESKKAHVHRTEAQAAAYWADSILVDRHVTRGTPRVLQQRHHPDQSRRLLLRTGTHGRSLSCLHPVAKPPSQEASLGQRGSCHVQTDRKPMCSHLSLWTKGRLEFVYFHVKPFPSAFYFVQNWKNVRVWLTTVCFTFTRGMGLGHFWQAGVNLPELSLGGPVP